MKTCALRVAVPTLTLPSAPVRVPVVVGGAVVKQIKVLQLTTATATQQMGFRITNNGINVFPFSGDGLNPGEDGWAPVGYGSPIDFDIFETLDGPPYNVEALFFNLTGATVYVDVLISTDGKERPRQIEKVVPADMEVSKVSG